MRCGYLTCKDKAITKCYVCGSPLCERHTRKRPFISGIFGTNYCPDHAMKKTVHYDVTYREDKKKKGCFIATATYGTPFTKEINVLRKWRDDSLMSNYFGRIFIIFYYIISPPIARVVSKSEFLKKIVRFSLNPLIKNLKRKVN